jgi:hypothetical protein
MGGNTQIMIMPERKPRKSPRAGQITLLSLGSFAAAFLLLNSVSGVSEFRIFLFVGSFLISALFATPVVVRKKSLFYIPGALLLLPAIILFFSGFSDALLLLIVYAITAVMASIGIGAGVLLRRAMDKIETARLRNRFLARTAGIAILLVPFLFAINLFLGDPGASLYVYHKFHVYLKEVCPEVEFAISFPHWDERYISNAAEKGSGEHRFILTYYKGEIELYRGVETGLKCRSAGAYGIWE